MSSLVSSNVGGARPSSGRTRLPPIKPSTRRLHVRAAPKPLRTKRGNATSLGLRLIGKRRQDFDVLTLILRTPPTSARNTPRPSRPITPKHAVTSSTASQRPFDAGAVSLKLESLSSGVKLQKMENETGPAMTSRKVIDTIEDIASDAFGAESQKLQEKRSEVKDEQLDEEQLKQKMMILTGSQAMADIPALPKKIVRIFVSSTFTG